MSDNEYAKVIAKNLKRIAADHEKTQADIARDLHINQGTVSTWMVGTRVPRMDKIDMLCNYFNCSRAEIMEETPRSAERTFPLTNKDSSPCSVLLTLWDVQKQYGAYLRWQS